MPVSGNMPTNAVPDDHQALIQIAVARQNDVLIITAVEGTRDRIVYVNDAITQHSGYSPAEVIGNTPRMFQGPDTSRETLDLIRSAVDSQSPIRAELLNYRKDGSTYWIEINISPIFNPAGKATHMVAAQRDITERKVMQEVMQRTDQRFLLALEASANAIWEWSIASDSFEYRDEMPGRSWHGRHHGVIRGQGLGPLLELVHPDDRDRVARAMQSELKACTPLRIEEYRLRRPNGSYAHVSDRHFILRGPDGVAERMIGSILDISAERELDRRMGQSERLALMGEMTGGIAHNFNNLLTVILGNVDRLRGDDLDAEARQATLRMIDDAAQRGAALTEHLMTFSQVDKLTLKPTDIHRLIDSLSPVCRNLLPPDIDFDILQEDGLWPVSTDPTHLEAAILNLVINARDAMPDGGKLTIAVENLEQGSAVIRARDGVDPSRYVVIRVSDTGTGMSPETVKAAFDPFFTTKPQGKGTGLGLSSAYGFMQQSGGFMRLSSTLGEGTEVRMFLRVADKLPLPGISQDDNVPMKDGGHHILIVDDDALVREYVRTMLASLRYRVTTASNGAEALELLASGTDFDLLFTDILMEGSMNGWELARQAQALYPDLPVLFTSAYPDLDESPAEGQARTVTILRKPYRASDLAVAILSAIARNEGS